MAGIKLLAYLAALGLPSLGLAQATPEDLESIIGPIEPLSIQTCRYIVRFSNASSARFRKRDGSLDASSFFAILDETAPDVTPVTTFDSALFHGASFDLADGTADAILTIPETTRAQAVAVSDIPAWSPHNDTNVAEAHAWGYRGEGASIAIVNSGVDYTHPALRGGLGPGFKVEAGHDFVGDDCPRTTTPRTVAATATSDSGETREIIYVTYDSLQWNFDGTLPGAGAPDYDTCDWAIVPTVRNALLVSLRGRCTWPIHDLGMIDQVEYVLYYNFEGSRYSRPDRVFLPGAAREVGLISYENGTWVTSQYEQGHTVSFDFVHGQRPFGIRVEGYTGGRSDISAPGGEIFSTYPVNSGSWAVLSGTSMATPFIAGVAGLYLAAQGGRNILGVKAANIARKRIVASGQPVRHSDGTDNPGRAEVLESTIDVSPANINLNDTVNFKPKG